MDYYNYSVDLPFTKTKINFREINTQEQILIAKANLSFPNEKESIYEYHKYVLSVILNCIQNKEDFFKINIIEYVLFLVKLRIISVGSTIEFTLKGEEDKKTKTKIQINLKNYLLNLYNSAFFEDKEREYVLNENNIKIMISWPKIKTISTFNEYFLNNKTEYEIFNNSLFEFIDYMIVNGNKIDWNILTTEEKITLFDKFPLLLKNKIENEIIELNKKLIENNIFEIEFFKDYRFSIYNLSFIEHIKMIFSYDLKSLFREIYYLASNNIPPKYIMDISDSERKIYLTIIQEELKKQNESSSKSTLTNVPETEVGYSDAVKNLALEFGQDLSK